MTGLVELTWALVFAAAALAAYLLGGLMVWGGRGVLARRSGLGAIAGLAAVMGLLVWLTVSSFAAQAGSQRWTLVQAGWSACHAAAIGKKSVVLDHCQAVGVFRNDGGSANGLDVYVATFSDRGRATCTAALSDLAQHGQSVTVSCTVAGVMGSGTTGPSSSGGIDTSRPPQVAIQSQNLSQQLGNPAPGPT